MYRCTTAAYIMYRILGGIEFRTIFLESVHQYVNAIIPFIANFINFNLLNSVQLRACAWVALPYCPARSLIALRIGVSSIWGGRVSHPYTLLEFRPDYQIDQNQVSQKLIIVDFRMRKVERFAKQKYGAKT